MAPASHPVTSTETLVLGAGYSGLTAAAVLAKEGRDVILLEAHDTLGGCASFFRTGKYTFDVGATTFSGVRPDQPAGMVFDHLGIEPEFEKVDPGMIIRLPDTDIVRWSDQQTWIDYVAFRFTTGDQRGFWNELYRLEAGVWDLISNKPYLPPSTVSDWSRMLDPRNVKGLPMLPGLFRSMRSLMKKYGVDEDPAFMRFVNEQMLISTQSNADQAPYLTGAMGLTYPSETYYPVGGMVRPALLMMRSIKENGGEVKFRREVTEIRQEAEGRRQEGSWLVTCSNGEQYRARNVVSSIPIWNMATLVQGKAREHYRDLASRFSSSWCALTSYFALKGTPQLESPYVQLHVTEDIPYVHSNSLFLTVSRPDDHLKAPEGETTVTVSTHARAADWTDITPEEHERRKAQVTAAMMRQIDERMPEFSGMQRDLVEGGTPWTWIRYTNRHQGYVGGIPHTVSKNLLSMPKNQTPFAGLYQIGDSAFPGQGTPAVMLGAWNTAARILGGVPTRSFAR